MVDKLTTPGRNVVDFQSYQERKASARALVETALAATALVLSPRACRHCGAALLEGEIEDECSSAAVHGDVPPQRRSRQFQAD